MQKIKFRYFKLILAKLYDEQNTADNEEYKFQIFSFSEDKNDLEDPDSAYDRINTIFSH